jgi:hypothetical protein
VAAPERVGTDRRRRLDAFAPQRGVGLVDDLVPVDAALSVGESEPARASEGAEGRALS